MNFHASTILALSAALALSACNKKEIDPGLPVPGDNTAQTPWGGSSIIPGSNADFLQQMGGKEVIYFDTDRFNIDDVDAAALQKQAQWLSRYPGKRATIEGHADERGTREYNLALGERRANAAKNYLTSLGIEASRITVISYGEERPVAVGSDQSAWAQNRRAVTITID